MLNRLNLLISFTVLIEQLTQVSHKIHAVILKSLIKYTHTIHAARQYEKYYS